MVDNGQLTRKGQDVNVVPKKYPSWPAWAEAQNKRLKSWGFNTVGMYSYSFQIPRNYPAAGVPVEATLQVSGQAKRDDRDFYHCKSINYDYGSMVCASSYVPGGGGQLDVFDKSCDGGKGVSGAFKDDLDTGPSNLYCTNCGGPPVSDVIFVTTEEADDLFGLNSAYTHDDLGYDIAAHTPMVKTSPNHPAYRYPNATLDAKIALRDFLANEYGCSNPSGGIGTPVADGDDLYSSSAFCGSAASSKSLAALNSAWGTGYTTWSTSDPTGEGGIKTGSYKSYGTGTGFLDENGAHILSLAYRHHCNLHGGLLPINAWSARSQIEADLHRFVAYFARTYAQKLAAGWAQPSANPHPPIFVPIYDGPSYVYTAIAPYFDGFWVNPWQGSTKVMSLSDLQRIIAASSVKGGKSMPIIIGDYSAANPDSPFPDAHSGNPQFATQAERGSGMVKWWRSALRQRDVNGKLVVVGLEHWGFYDQANEGWNAGLVTADHDNPYDGSANIANGEAENYGDTITPLEHFLKTGLCDESGD